MNESNNENIFSRKLRAGKRRTYFFDVRATKGNDYFVTLTESKRRFNSEGYDRHKIFLYKEDFNKFLTALTETIDHVKTTLMPDFDFDSFNHEEHDEYRSAPLHSPHQAPAPAAMPASEQISAADLPDEIDTQEMHAEEIKTDLASNNTKLENPTSNDEAETW